MSQRLLEEHLRIFLLRTGPSAARGICQALGISQPTFSRLVSQAKIPILRTGKGRLTQYALTRSGLWGKPEIPVFSVDEEGKIAPSAVLHGVLPRGFYLESNFPTIATKFHPSLPYLFEDLRPSGFLGRLLPRLHPDLDLPDDIQIWTDDHCLKYLTQYGWDLTGNFILGDAAYEGYLRGRMKGPAVVPVADRGRLYPRAADQVLITGGPAGSSAAGEQPKFLATCETVNGRIPVLVKFSPPLNDTIGRRVADLLVCEHIAHEVLRGCGFASAKSCLISGGNRLFLEMERFDRTSKNGRKGVISLRALDLEFVGNLRTWSDTAEALFRQKRIDQAAYQRIVWLEVFGRLIGNTDRHHANISFFAEGEHLAGLAPVYDMLPMLYAPQQNQLVERNFDPPPPKVPEIPFWSEALAAAGRFWDQVRSHPQISPEFKLMTADNGQVLAKQGHY